MISYVKKVVKSNRYLFNVANKGFYITGMIKYRFYPEKAAKRMMEKSLRRKIDLENPETLTEKIMYINLYNQHELASKLADKYAVRDYIKEKGYENILVDLLGVYNNADEIDFDKLPNRFVLKCNHGSGYNIICKDKSKLNINKTKRKLNGWLKQNYSYYAFEKHYSHIEPKIICEKYIEELGNESLHCINGKYMFSECCVNRGKNESYCFYDKYWKKINCTNRSIDIESNASKPINHDEIVRIALDLSKPFKYVRIDFYDTESGPLLSELTFTPMGCRISEGFSYKFDSQLGKQLSIG